MASAAKANDLGFIGHEKCRSTSCGKANELGFLVDDSVTHPRGSRANDLGFIYDDYDDEDECRVGSHRRSDRVRACKGGEGSSASLDPSLLDYVNTFLAEGYKTITAEEVFNVFRGIGQSRSKIECRKIAEEVRVRASASASASFY